LDNEAFPWLGVRTIDIGYTKAIAVRVNYVGELGWELHMPLRAPAQRLRLAREAGARFGLADFGLYAMDSLRLEKCYRSWKADLTTEYTPFMASLDRFVKLDKPGGFIGQEALRREAASGPRERFVPLLVDRDADAAAVSVVYSGDECVGLVTSGGYGYRLQQSIALAYVRSDLARPGTALTVEILGERRRRRRRRTALRSVESRLRADLSAGLIRHRAQGTAPASVSFGVSIRALACVSTG
jgi:dimethylglycine dehydrogenase